jgi:tRNA A37 methylthiotransferase MiaB
MYQDQLREEYDADAITVESMQKLDDIISAKVPFSQVPYANYVDDEVNRSWRYFSQIDRLITRNWTRPFFWSYSESTTKKLKNILLRRSPITEPRIFNITIGTGCLSKCSYCGTRLAMGKLKSKELQNILTEFRVGLKSGFTHFRLVCGDVAAWGQDIGSSFIVLLKELFKPRSDYRFDLPDLNLRWLLSDKTQLIDLIASNADKILRLNFPIQSGSDKILGLMERGYSCTEATGFLKLLRAKCPSVPLLTQIIVGFPGEKEIDFRRTIDFLKAIDFDLIQIFRYSDRPMTEAASMPDKVLSPVKISRMNKLVSEFPKSARLIV